MKKLTDEELKEMDESLIRALKAKALFLKVHRNSTWLRHPNTSARSAMGVKPGRCADSQWYIPVSFWDRAYGESFSAIQPRTGPPRTLNSGTPIMFQMKDVDFSALEMTLASYHVKEAMDKRAELMIMQRVHQNDPAYHYMNKHNWPCTRRNDQEDAAVYAIMCFSMASDAIKSNAAKQKNRRF